MSFHQRLDRHEGSLQELENRITEIEAILKRKLAMEFCRGCGRLCDIGQEHYCSVKCKDRHTRAAFIW